MSDLLDKRVQEWGVWYLSNRKRIPEMDLKKRLDFTDKALQGCIELLAIACKDLQFLERRDPRRKLYLPREMHMIDDNGNVQRFSDG